MKKTLCMAVALFYFLPLTAGAQYIMPPREMLFDPRSKNFFKGLPQPDRVESIGNVLALDREKELPRKTISERAYKVDECVMKHIEDEGYKHRDLMTVITDCAAVLGYD